jgi:hypothetical protein
MSQQVEIRRDGVAGDAYSSLQLLHQRKQAQESCQQLWTTATADNDGGGCKVWDTAKLLRSVLQQVNVQKHA